MSESGIFRAAVKLPPEKRAAYLDDACGSDPNLRKALELLLKAHETANSFLKDDPVSPHPTADFSPIAEGPGTVIGPYKLMEQIGEGGFGLVFVAEQHQPVRRKVALKIIKPGMDTREVVARFEMERQALALMDHPHIARVFDGGTTQSGRPYFVMELVRGIPIIEYCDQQQLTARERLALFVTVCQAAQHAHAKGIIHRDLKPSNILIAPHDGVPVVKVIDFGVAKAIGQQLTDKTIYTRFAQMIGTPLYMSPEQAEINALDVDIRSDVYSLGVLLYELLTGTTPFDPQRLRSAAYDEIRRIIREEEPPKPSARLSTMGESLTKVSSQRRTEPTALSALVRGDLDWIVMKCLEKDRTRRYETASGLAKDVQRYLADEPIEARPPSIAYRAQKFFNRHRGPVITAVAIVALLGLGLLGTLLGLIRARAAAKEAALAEAAALADRDDKEKARQAEARARASALRERDDAQRAREELRTALYRTDMNLLQSAWEANNTSRVLQILAAHLPQTTERDLRGFEWHYWDRLCHSELRSLQFNLGSPPLQPRRDFVVISAQGNVCAAITFPDPKQTRSVIIRAWNTADGRELHAFPLDAPETIVRLALSGDGQRMAVSVSPLGDGSVAEGRIVIWDITNRKELTTVPIPVATDSRHSQSNRAIRPMLSHNGRRLAAFLPAVLDDKSQLRLPSVMVWDVDDGSSSHVFTHPGMSPGSALSPDGSHIATLALGAEKGNPLHWNLRLRDAVTGEFVVTTSWPTPVGPRAKVDPQHLDSTALIYSPDGSRLAGIQQHQDGAPGAPSGLGVIWDNVGQLLTTFQPDLRVAYLSFRPDGKQLLTWFGDRNPVGTVWDTSTGKVLRTCKGQLNPVVAASFTENGTRLIAIELGGSTRVWDAESPEARRIPRQLDSVTQWSLDGSRQAVFRTRSTDGIDIRDASGQELTRLTKHQSPVTSVQLSSDGRHLISLDQDEALKVWDTKTGEVKIEQQWPPGTRSKATPIFSLDEHRLAMRDPEGGIKVWELTPEVREVFSCQDQPRAAVLSANGRKVAMICIPPPGEKEGELVVWDCDSAKRTSLARGRFQNPLLSPDGNYLAVQRGTAGRTGFINLNLSVEVEIWRFASEEKPVVLKGEVAYGMMAFSPDSKRLATSAVPNAQTMGDILLWDVVTGEPQMRLAGHTNTPMAFEFDPTGQRLASIAQPFNSPYGQLKLWDVVTGSEVLGLNTASMLTEQRLFRFSPDGRRIFLMSDTGLEVWQQHWDATPRNAAVSR